MGIWILVLGVVGTIFYFYKYNSIRNSSGGFHGSDDYTSADSAERQSMLPAWLMPLGFFSFILAVVGMFMVILS